MNFNLTSRLTRWKDEGKITAGQHALFTALVRQEPFSVFLELNALLYLGVLSFIFGLGWTVRVYFHQLGDIAVITGLTGLFGACLTACFMQGLPYARTEVESPTLLFDYILYLGCLSWSVELGYLEMRFHLMSGQWDIYLLASAFFFLAMAYRFDNRFVLSLALTTLAAWFGLKISHFGFENTASLRGAALVYGVLIAATGQGLASTGIKKHFLGTYFNFAANVLFAAILSGVFSDGEFSLWTAALLAAAAASALYGTRTRQFVFVAYAAVYGYIGVSSLLIRRIHEDTLLFLYFGVSGIAMVGSLVLLARKFGREA